MTLKNIRDNIIARVGPDTELEVADYNVFINQGKSLIEAKILEQNQNFFVDTEELSLASLATEATPTKTWVTMVLITSDDGTGEVPLAKLSLEEVTNTANKRLGYCLWGTTLKFTAQTLARTIKIYGYVVPVDLSADGDSPTFPSPLHHLLITWGHGCAVEAASSDQNFLDGERKRIEFWSELDIILPTFIIPAGTNVKSLI